MLSIIKFKTDNSIYLYDNVNNFGVNVYSNINSYKGIYIENFNRHFIIEHEFLNEIILKTNSNFIKVIDKTKCQALILSNIGNRCMLVDFKHGVIYNNPMPKKYYEKTNHKLKDNYRLKIKIKNKIK